MINLIIKKMNYELFIILYGDIYSGLDINNFMYYASV